jgi:hypothetical protein
VTIEVLSLSLKEAEQWATQYLKDEMNAQEIKIMGAKPYIDVGFEVSGIFSDNDGKNNFTLIFNQNGELLSKEVSRIQKPIFRTTGR